MVWFLLLGAVDSVDFCCCLRRIFYVWFFSVVVVSDFVLTCFLLLPFFSSSVCLDFVLFLLFGLFWSVIWFCCFLLRPVAFFSGDSVTPVVVFVDFCPGFNFRWSLLFIFCFLLFLCLIYFFLFFISLVFPLPAFCCFCYPSCYPSFPVTSCYCCYSCCSFFSSC